MYYYLVWVRSNRYHGAEPLTYSAEQKIATGSIVVVELQRQQVLGVVSGTTTEPRFKTKPITEILSLPPIPGHLLKLANWLKSYYPAPVGIITQQLLPAKLTAKRLTSSSSKLEFTKPQMKSLPPLTNEQQAALKTMSERESYLLHGITGSGKTRLYIELAASVIG